MFVGAKASERTFSDADDGATGQGWVCGGIKQLPTAIVE